MNKCNKCGSDDLFYRLRVYENKLAKSIIDPKWLPHIQKFCNNCGAYVETCKQTEELRSIIDGMNLYPQGIHKDQQKLL